MIHTLTYYNMPGRDRANVWKAVHDLLEHTNDKIIFVVTRQQYGGFESMMKESDLEKFATVRHGLEEGVNNPNYKGDTGKLKVWILQGKGES